MRRKPGGHPGQSSMLAAAVFFVKAAQELQHELAESAEKRALDGSTTANWQVQFPSGWHDLPPQASSEIEAARLRGENVAIYEQCRSKKQNWWDTYQMDLANMQQTNVRSGTRRMARRIVDAGFEASSAAMPKELHAYGSLSTVARDNETLRGV